MGVSLFRRSLVTAVAVSGLMGATAFAQQKEVTIAHQDMMVPWRYAQVTGAIEKATGYKINFRKFGGGGDVIRAMASGQVQIGEAGSAPVASALSQGLPVELIWILDDIADAEALVARKGSGVKTVADLKGKKIGVPFTSTTHFHTLVALEAAKVNPNDVRILNMRPPEIAAAWERGDIDATFIWDPVLAKVKGNGRFTLVFRGRSGRNATLQLVRRGVYAGPVVLAKSGRGVLMHLSGRNGNVGVPAPALAPRPFLKAAGGPPSSASKRPA